MLAERETKIETAAVSCVCFYFPVTKTVDAACLRRNRYQLQKVGLRVRSVNRWSVTITASPMVYFSSKMVRVPSKVGLRNGPVISRLRARGAFPLISYIFRTTIALLLHQISASETVRGYIYFSGPSWRADETELAFRRALVYYVFMKSDS